MKSFVIIAYTPKEHEGFSRYLREAFHEKYILSDARYLDWQYRQGNLLLAKDGNEIIGHFGFRDVAYKFYDHIADVRVLMNLYVQERYRMTGVSSLLAERVCGGARPLLVSGYTPLAEKLFNHIRPAWQNAGTLKRMIAVLDNTAPLLAGYRIPFAALTFDSGRDSDITECFPTNTFVDECKERLQNRFPISILRTRDYISWRFISHPFFAYRVLAARQNGFAKGYLIWRLEEDQGFRIARIIDFFSAPEAEQPLLRAFLAAARRVSAHVADFLLSGKWYGASLASTGFFNAAGTDFEKFPILFSPLSYKKVSINIGYDFAAQFEDCFFTKADGDQDRPNPH